MPNLWPFMLIRSRKNPLSFPAGLRHIFNSDRGLQPMRILPEPGDFPALKKGARGQGRECLPDAVVREAKRTGCKSMPYASTEGYVQDRT